MNRVISYFLLLWVLVGCSRPTQQLQQAEACMQRRPDSALKILKSIPASQLHRKSDQALYALLYTQAQNKNNIPFTTDSLINIATDYYDEAEPERAGYAWFYKSLFLKEYGDTKQTVDAFLKAQEYAESSNQNKLKGIVYAEKAELYASQNQLDSTSRYNLKAATCFQAAGDYYNQTIVLIRLGNSYTLQKNNSIAMAFLKKALQSESMCKAPLLKVTILNCIGFLQSSQSQYDAAKATLHKIPSIHDQVYDTNKYLTLADLFVKTKQFDSANYYLGKVPLQQRSRECYSELKMNIEESRKDYAEALVFSKKIISYNDSLNRKQLDASFAGLEKKYNYQSLKLKNQHLLLRNKRYTITVLGLVLAFLGCFTLFLWWRYRTRKHIIDSQKSELETKQKLIVQESENRALVELQLEKEKQLLEQQLINNQLIETQLRVQKVLFEKMEQYKKHVHKPKNNQHPCVTPVYNPVFDQELIIYIDMEYNDFSHRLKNKYPGLTEREVLICCLALAGFNTGMTAAVLDILQESVVKSRHRIRKRLRVENE